MTNKHQQSPDGAREARTERVFARVTPSEKDQLKALAERFGYDDLSKFLRALSQIFEVAGLEPSLGG